VVTIGLIGAKNFIYLFTSYESTTGQINE
jgi:hypothetical protein